MTWRDALNDVPIFLVDREGRGYVERRNFPDVRSKIGFLAELATDPTQTRRAREVCRVVLGPHMGIDALRALHEWRALHLEFEAEREQILQSPDHVIVRRRGDCTAHAVLGGSLAWIAGADIAFPAMGGTELDPEHLSLLVTTMLSSRRMVPPAWIPWSPRCPTVGGWWWSDTSVPVGSTESGAFGRAPCCR